MEFESFKKDAKIKELETAKPITSKQSEEKKDEDEVASLRDHVKKLERELEDVQARNKNLSTSLLDSERVIQRLQRETELYKSKIAENEEMCMDTQRNVSWQL